LKEGLKELKKLKEIQSGINPGRLPLEDVEVEVRNEAIQRPRRAWDS
jgi:hypothetical protein